MLSKPDSTFYIFARVRIGRGNRNIELQSHLMQNLSIAYKEAKEYDKAEIFGQSFSLNNDSAEEVRYLS